MAGEVIRAKKCVQCGTINHLSKMRCLKCRSQQFTEVTHPPLGTVVTFTNCTALPERLGGRKSQGFAIVLLEEGWRVLGQLNDPATIAIGDRVTGNWAVVSQNRDKTPAYGWVFQKEASLA